MTYLKFLIFNLVLLLIGIVLFHINPSLQELASHKDASTWVTAGVPLISELSKALMIAVVLNLGVEFFTRQRHEALETATIERINSEVSKDLLTRVFNENLPANVVKQIRLHLFTAHVCKTYWRVHYSLEVKQDPNDASKQIVFWTATDDYTLKNMDRQAVKHSIQMEVEPSEYVELWHITGLSVEGKQVPCNESRDGRKVSVAHEVTLQPQQEMNVKTIQTGAGALHAHEVICSSLAVEKLTLIVKHPAELRINATSLHPVDETRLQDSAEGENRWELEAILPGQGIEVLWCPALVPN
jgi:hypothetical protein